MPRFKEIQIFKVKLIRNSIYTPKITQKTQVYRIRSQTFSYCVLFEGCGPAYPSFDTYLCLTRSKVTLPKIYFSFNFSKDLLRVIRYLVVVTAGSYGLNVQACAHKASLAEAVYNSFTLPVLKIEFLALYV